MDCRNLRIDFVRRSGRMDLVKPDGQDAFADNGANAYLNRGQRLLDSLLVLPHHERRLVAAVAAGAWHLDFECCRVVREVWCADAERRWSLEPVSLGELRRMHPAGDFSAVEPGVPRRYALSTHGLAPEQEALTAGDFEGDHGIDDVRFGDDAAARNGIVWMPPAASDLTLDVWALWWTKPLVNDDDLTWWSVNEPDLVVRAALASLESDYRNTEGYNDWMASMQSRLQVLDFDRAEQESAGYTRIEG